MMNDKELLELAAKAAGVKALWIKTLWSPDGELRDCTNDHPQDIYAAPPWNPLTDDGDALRLAIKLNLTVCSGPVYSYVVGCTQEKNNGDPYAATRRAIVRAAAEIGKWEGE